MKECIKGVSIAAGLDLGDRYSYLVVVGEDNQIVCEQRVRTRAVELTRCLSRFAGIRVAIETGTHSPWVGRLLKAEGHEVLICHARELLMIYQSRKKNDRSDAEKLARMARLDPQMLFPIKPRSESAQEHMQLLNMRDLLVRQRAALILQLRGLSKSLGLRLGRCSPSSFGQRMEVELPEKLRKHYGPMLQMIREMTNQIRCHDREVERLCRQVYPQTEIVRQIQGVGALSALAYVLWIEDPRRFSKARKVGSYLGLCPGQDESGQSSRGLPISKQGNGLVRRLLVQCAHYILGPFGRPSQLREQGQRLAAGGGRGAKRRAVVAIARKLSVVMLVLWRDGLVYEPFPAKVETA